MVLSSSDRLYSQPTSIIGRPLQVLNHFKLLLNEKPSCHMPLSSAVRPAPRVRDLLALDAELREDLLVRLSRAMAASIQLMYLHDSPFGLLRSMILARTPRSKPVSPMISLMASTNTLILHAMCASFNLWIWLGTANASIPWIRTLLGS